MHAFDVLADPTRRLILERLREGERSAGELVAEAQAAFGISQPAVSQHLAVLRAQGFVRARAEGRRRLYALCPEPLMAVDAWLAPFMDLWPRRLEALATEVARGKRRRRLREQEG